MVQYVVEKRKPVHPADPAMDGMEGVWVVLQLPDRIEVGTLRRFGEMFIATSEHFRNESESFDPFLALRMVFRVEQFFIFNDGHLRKLTEDDLK